MKTQKFTVTNNSGTSICLMGRQRVSIPGGCKDLVILLPDTSAKATVARLRKKYPALKIKAMEEIKKAEAPIAPASAPVPAAPAEAAQAEAKPEAKNEKKSNGK